MASAVTRGDVLRENHCNSRSSRVSLCQRVAEWTQLDTTGVAGGGPDGARVGRHRKFRTD